MFAIKKVVQDVVNPVKEISLDDARKFNPDVAIDGEVKEYGKLGKEPRSKS